ncbi:MAG TPA: zinc-binding dehydrogenase [Polyangiaceae bacterium]|nr:zinc-binding dehydrogenase [Polyangiaceae bacterium]
MKAVRFGRFGGPEVLEVVEEAIPELEAGQVLVRVRSSGVNLADSLMRENRYAVTPELPAIPGFEVAGVVERVAPGVAGIAAGARVAVPLFVAGAIQGGYREYVAVDAGIVVPLPDDLSFEAATALMMQGLTALYLVEQSRPQGKTVLVNAAAGGVGSLLLQLVKLAGARRVIAGASSTQKLEFARSLGADAGVDYTDANWVESLARDTDGVGPDLIYESVGGDVTRDSLRALAPGGTLVIYGALNIQSFALGVPELVSLIFKNQSLSGFALPTLLTRDGLKPRLAQLFAWAQSGALRVTIGGRYGLEQAGDAHRALSQRRTVGKLVLVT